MRAGEQPTADGALSRDQVLDELEFLAAVEHALLVEQWSLAYAFGHDLPPKRGRHHRPWTGGGRQVRHDRRHRGGIPAASDQPLPGRGRTRTRLQSGRRRVQPVGRRDRARPPTLAEPERLVGRQQPIAAAIEERFAALRPAATSEDCLLKASDRAYRTFLLAMLTRCTSIFDSHGALIPNAFIIGKDFQALAERFQATLDDINRLLVQRGLLPPFRLAVPFHALEPPGGSPPT